MKRVYYQEGQIRALRPSATSRDLRAVAAQRRRLEQQPDSRDRHRHLYRALSRAGKPEAALDLLERWLEREPASARALTLLAETAARLGQRDRALRALGSLVELAPHDAARLRRLARIHQALGATRRACDHWISLSVIAPGHRDAHRAADCRDGYRPPRRTGSPWGRVVLDGSWDRASDLDLALVGPGGRRIGWLSDRRRLAFADVASSRRERLALRWLPPGRYRIEVNRGRTGEETAVRGRVAVRGPGVTRRLSFRLAPGQQRAYLGELRIRRRERLVPAP